MIFTLVTIALAFGTLMIYISFIRAPRDEKYEEHKRIPLEDEINPAGPELASKES